MFGRASLKDIITDLDEANVESEKQRAWALIQIEERVDK